MERIIIRENDNTSNEVTSLGSDIVYVPGFAIEGNQPARTPKLCTSIGAFQEAFGDNAPTFLLTQNYPTNFDEAALPAQALNGGNNVWFNKGTADPSYIFAKELIRLGLPVVYERINEYDLTQEPAGIIADVDIFSTTTRYTAGDYVVQDNQYLKCMVENGPGEFNASDWAPVARNGKVLAEYSNTSAYSIGDYCVIADGSSVTYYKCIVEIEEPAPGSTHPFDTSEWEVVDDPSTVLYDVTVDKMYQAMTGVGLPEDETPIYANEVPGSLSEISTYNIKYITSGGYPTFEYLYSVNGSSTSMHLAQQLATLAATRGDAVALIDHTDNPYRPLTGKHSVYGHLNKFLYANNNVGYATVGDAVVTDTQDSENYRLSDATSTFGAIITPYCTYNTSSGTVSLPGSFGYLSALARSLQTYPSWLAVAGVTRGYVPSIAALNTQRPLTNAIADSYQSDPSKTDGSNTDIVSINAITYINDQGYILWGNRTLSTFKNKFATTFLNLRSLVSDVKKTAFKAAQRYMFEQNNDVLWINFKNEVEELLDSMVASMVVSAYKIVKITSTDKTKMAAKIQIQPVYAVESFEIDIILTDEELTIA